MAFRLFVVIPAQAGIQSLKKNHWIPPAYGLPGQACKPGMTT
jgi:hypothetical protein